jgi:hypothetical protein
VMLSPSASPGEYRPTSHGNQPGCGNFATDQPSHGDLAFFKLLPWQSLNVAFP